jgi:hypothetical protein
MERTTPLSCTVRQWARMGLAQHGVEFLEITRAQQQVFLKEGNLRLVEACQDLIDAMLLEMQPKP